MKKLLSLLVVSLLVCSFGVCRAGENEAEDYYNNGGSGVIPLVREELTLPTEIVTGTITLTEGWNLIAMPVLPVRPYTVERFIKEVESPIRRIIEPLPDLGKVVVEDSIKVPIRLLPYWEVPLVAVYKNGHFERYPKEGIQYNMVPGEAYFVYARYMGPRMVADQIQYPDGTTMPPIFEWHPKTSVTIPGKPLNVPVSLDLNRGWNGVSVLKPIISEREKPYWIDRLSKELVAQDIKATRVAFWLADKQEWEQHALPTDTPDMREMESFIDPSVGFFLLSEENGLFIPGLNMNPEPPVPPFPPKPPFEERVSYTGKLDMVCGIPENMPPYEFAIFPYNEKKAISLMTTTDDVKAQLSAIYQAEDLCTVGGVMKHIRWGGYWPGESSHEEDVLMVNTVKKVYSMDPVMAELKAREYLAGLLGVDQGEITIVGSYDATIQKDGEIERRIIGVAIRVVTLKYNEREYLVKTTCAMYPGDEWGSFQVLLFL